jgi:phage shock protein B
MDDNTTTLLIVLASMAGLVALRYLKLQAQRGGRLSAADQAMLDNMAHLATRLEQRVVTLERILDDQVPAWRAMDAGVGR